ncbi:hypothetical protein BGZ68_007449, partial [Mortierella alpina]
MDHHPSDAQSFAGALLPTLLKNPLKSRLLDLAHHHNSDLTTAVLVAWIILLSRLSGQESIVLDVGSTDEAGTLRDLLSLSVDVSAEFDTSQLFERVKLILGTTKARQPAVDSPIKTSKNDEEPYLSQASFYSQDSSLGKSWTDPVSTRYCLELHLLQDGENVTMTFHYAADLYNKDTIERYAGYLQAVLLNMVTSKGRPVSAFNILSAAEKKLLLETWNAADQPFPDSSCLHQLFESQVETSPEAIAIVQDGRMLTYRELNSRANWIADQLVEMGARAGDYVMLLLDRSIELVASEIAVLKIGAAYVPIDTKAPSERQAYIASDCGSTVLITNELTDIPLGIQATVLCVNTKGDNNEYMQ